jgi:hypothetical protein
MLRLSSAIFILSTWFILFLAYCGYFMWELRNELLSADFTVLLYVVTACCLLSVLTLASLYLFFLLSDTIPLMNECCLVRRMRRICTHLKGIQK